MVNSTPAKLYAVFYAHKERFISALLEDGSVRDKLGTTMNLNVRSLHERAGTCPHPGTYPCCTHLSDCGPCRPETTRNYKIVGIKVFEGDGKFAGDDGIDNVLEDREWQDKLAIDNPDFFDWYFATNILGAYQLKTDPFPLAGSILVDIEPQE